MLVGSLLFGLFFGAGNLIFPVYMGQEAGTSIVPAVLGFLTTAIGVPFLGVVAIGVSRSSGLFNLSSRVHPFFGYMMTILLYLTIGPFFAIPRTASVSFEVGIASFVGESWRGGVLAGFSLLFFCGVLFFSLRNSNILTWVGKILNPLFLVFLSVLMGAALFFPMGELLPGSGDYSTAPFFSGFIAGYNTMDAIASLAFGIIVIQTLKDIGVSSPRGLAWGTVRAGGVSMVLMGLIYAILTFMGASSVGRIGMTSNGGLSLALIARHYFGSAGGVLLALIITLACLKTAVGLITACAGTFVRIFPRSLGYRTYVYVFTGISCLIANVGLTRIISLSVPVLMLLYPLAISLIILGLLSPFFRDSRNVYFCGIIAVIPVSIGDFLRSLPESVARLSSFGAYIDFCGKTFPWFELGLGWFVPLCVGTGAGWLWILIAGKRHFARNAGQEGTNEDS